MEKKILGRTGFSVTKLAYGAMELRGPRIWDGRKITEEQAQRILNAVLDAGINFIDTSYDYGRSEELIGKFISKRRDEYYLATKCGCMLSNKGDHDETLHVWTRDNLLHNIEVSLRRLKTEAIDLWQLHNPSPEAVKKGALLNVMEEVKAKGMVRRIGISTTQPEIEEFIKWDVFDSFQVPYSALQREHEEAISQAAAAGAGVIVRGGVARGDRAAGGQGEKTFWDTWEKARLDELLEAGQSRTGFLLRFTLSHPGMHTTIVGSLNPRHLVENLTQARAGALAEDVYDEAKRRLSAVKPIKV